ncbi:MAG: hypothetical protein FWG73_07745 [Planctomycetaceae bacterium]|nr:hypothetical protein [Planctomycetaceae bacterium]
MSSRLSDRDLPSVVGNVGDCRPTRKTVLGAEYRTLPPGGRQPTFNYTYLSVP